MIGATLFSGFEGVGIGMKAAGIKHAWGLEYNADIAAVAQMNGFNTIVADILDCNPADFERVTYLHASPPCPNFSNAKANGEETELDISLAQKVAEFITILRPRFFTLENVYQYRTSQSWGIIERALHEAGYLFDYWHVCMADYGVPQTRRRMIAIARLDGIRPQLPPATHAENPISGLFGTLRTWVGWYEAIEDLIPGLPESKFADWQLKRLPDEIKETTLFANGQYDGVIPLATEKEPAGTITGDDNQVTRRTLIVDGRNSNQQWGKLYREGEEPATAVTALERSAHLPRAFVVDHQNISRDATIRMENEPFITVQSLQMRRPSSTPSAYTNGRIVQMTTRALARFQSFPDSYQLPENKRLACRGIGNAVPPRFAQRMFESLL